MPSSCIGLTIVSCTVLSSMSPVFWASVGLVYWSSAIWTCLMPVSSVCKDSSCRVPSGVSACVIPACDFMFGAITSSSCSYGSEVGEVLVLLMVPSTVYSRAFLCCFSMSFMTLLEKGIDGDTDVFKLVPTAANDGYSDWCGMFGITCWKGDSFCALSIVC